MHGSITFIGTATILLRFGGFTILTDPNFLHKHEKVHLGYGLQSERLTDPAMELADVMPVDFVLLSHYHEDHFDRQVEANLDKKLPIITTVPAAKTLQHKGFSLAQGLDTWGSTTMASPESKLTITAMPGRHGPGLVAKLLPTVMGSLLQFELVDGRSLRLYITGDTLVFDDIKKIPQRYPNIDVALLHLGGTKALGIMVTMDGKQGAQMVKLLNAHTNIPIHYDDYTVFKSPLADFKHEIEAAGLEDKVHYLARGERYDFTV